MFARTERLLLRPGFVEDAAELAQAIGEEAIVRNLATAPWPYGETEARAFLSMDHNPALPRLTILKRGNGTPRIVGGVGIAPRADGDGLELGYWIARPYWGLGFATEAGRAVLRIARAMQLPRLTAGHFIDNPASGAVLRKLGFRPTGRTVNRYSLARGGEAASAEYAEGEDSGVDAMTGKRSRIAPHEDFRHELRLMAA
jgi:RimJ/RimL family protein N-acetyltransferase